MSTRNRIRNTQYAIRYAIRMRSTQYAIRNEPHSQLRITQYAIRNTHTHSRWRCAEPWNTQYAMHCAYAPVEVYQSLEYTHTQYAIRIRTHGGGVQSPGIAIRNTPIAYALRWGAEPWNTPTRTQYANQPPGPHTQTLAIHTSSPHLRRNHIVNAAQKACETPTAS